MPDVGGLLADALAAFSRLSSPTPIELLSEMPFVPCLGRAFDNDNDHDLCREQCPVHSTVIRLPRSRNEAALGSGPTLRIATGLAARWCRIGITLPRSRTQFGLAPPLLQHPLAASSCVKYSFQRHNGLFHPDAVFGVEKKIRHAR
jgi:hypothetical protein